MYIQSVYPIKGLLFVAFMLCLSDICHAQARPRIDIDFLVPDPSFGSQRLLGVNSESNKVDALGKPTVVPSARRFYYFPFFALKKDVAGKVIINETTKGVVEMPIIYDIPSTARIFKNYLIEKDLITDHTTDGNILMAPIKQLIVETDPTYRYQLRFTPQQVTGIVPEGRFTAKITNPEILKEFLTEVRGGKVSFKATAVFEGYDVKQNIATVDFNTLQQATVNNSIDGSGGKGFVNRKQIGKVARDAVIMKDISIRTEFDDPNFNALVTGLLQSLPPLEPKPLGDSTEWDKKFLEFGFDKNDLKADLITASSSQMNKETSTKFQQELERLEKSKSGGGGSFLGFSASVDLANESKDYSKVVREVFDKYGIKSDFNGNRIIPKAVSVYQFNQSSWQKQGIFTVGTARASQIEGQKVFEIHPETNFFSYGAVSPLEARIAELVPVGTIVAYGGKLENIPDGWLPCDGTERPVKEFPDLDRLLSTNWGTPNPGYLKLPDLRGKFLRGLDPSGTGDPDGAKRTVGSFQGDQVGSHPHTIKLKNTNYEYLHVAPISDSELSAGFKEGVNFANGTTQGIGRKNMAENMEVSINESRETRPKNVAVYYIIKARP